MPDSSQPRRSIRRSLKARLGPRAFGRHLGLQLTQSLAETGFRTLAVLVTARLFGVEAFGMLSLVLAAAGVHQLLMDGMWASVVRTVSESGALGEAAQARTGWRAGWLSTVTGLVVAVPLLFLFWLARPAAFAGSGALVAAGLAYALAVNWKVSLEASFRGLQRFGPPAKWGVGIAPVQAALLIASALRGGGVVEYVAILAVTTLVNAVALAAHFARAVLGPLGARVGGVVPLAPMVRYALPQMARGGMSWFLLRANPVMVVLWAGAAEAGLYGLTEKFLLVPLLATGAFVNAVAPRVSAAQGRGKLMELEPFLARVYGALFWVLAPITLLFFFNDPLVAWVFPEYVEASPTIRVFGLMLIIQGWAGVAQMGLLVQGGHGGVFTVLTLLQAVGNVAVLSLLIPAMGSLGAAWGTVGMYTLVGVVSLVLAHRRLGIRFGVRLWG